MFLHLNKDRKIIAYNIFFGRVDIEKIYDADGWIWYEGQFSFEMGEDRKGFEKAFYLEPDGEIRIEYEPVPRRQPTPEEVMQAKLDYLAMMAD